MADAIARKINSKENFIDISPQGIHWGFHANYIEEEDGMFSWYIPSFDIYFTSNTKEEGDQIARNITESFFNYWLKEKGFRKFLMKILRLGYKPSSHEELKNLLERKNLIAHLRGVSSRMPKEFAESETSNQDGNLAIAV